MANPITTNIRIRRERGRYRLQGTYRSETAAIGDEVRTPLFCQRISVRDLQSQDQATCAHERMYVDATGDCTKGAIRGMA